MADIKKYLSLERLSEYDALLKAKMAQDDASTLESAKEYVDGLIEGVNTSIANITNGDVTVKEAEHATSAGSAESATKATQDGNGNVIADTYETKTDAESKLTEAKEYTDTLKTYVGTIPETATATDVVGYVQEKTAGIATSENLAELTNRVALAETDIDNIQKDYLTSTDKEALQNNIDAVSSAVELLTNGVNAETVDGVNDLIAYVNAHGTEVIGMQTDIKANTDAIAGLATVAKTGSWNDLADRPFYEEDSGAIIEWDGNTEGLESIPMGEGIVFYKISDLTPAEEDFYGTVQTGPNNGAEISETGQGMMWISDGVLQAGFLYVITASEFTLQGVTFSVPSPGTYTLFDGKQYFAYTEIGSYAIRQLDEKFIPDTIARVEDQVALSDRINALEAWHEDFEEISTEDINGLFA